MKKRHVEVGDKYHRLEVVEVLEGLDILVKCVCNPDHHFKIKRSSLFHNLTKSCGCLNTEKRAQRVTTHGLSNSKLYVIYNGIIHRCYHINHRGYKNYGKRGIRIYQDWNPYIIGWTDAFMNFKYWADNNGYRDGLSIERIDNDGNYCPNNCKFIPLVEQMDHTRKTKYFTYKGITKTATQWAKDPRCRVSREILYNRLRLGWEFEKALTTKLMANNQRK